MRTESSAALKFLYPVVVRVTGLCGVMLLIFTFLVFPRSRNTMELDEEVQIIIEQIDIPQTEQFDRPPPPARPSVPVESESEDIADDVTLDEFNFSAGAIIRDRLLNRTSNSILQGTNYAFKNTLPCSYFSF